MKRLLIIHYMEINEAIRNRRSVRKVKDISVAKELFEELAGLGRWAPSNCNTQGWRFVIVTDQKLSQKLVQFKGVRSVLTPLPSLILLFSITIEIIYLFIFRKKRSKMKVLLVRPNYRSHIIAPPFIFSIKNAILTLLSRSPSSTINFATRGQVMCPQNSVVNREQYTHCNEKNITYNSCIQWSECSN